MIFEHDLVFVVGDIHGRADLLEQMQNHIQTLAVNSKYQRCKIIYLGDYIDRGPNSFQTINLLISGLKSFDRVFLKGNHEKLLEPMLFPNPGAFALNWISNGGDATLRSYGIACAGLEEFAPSPNIFQEELSKAMPQEHKEFFNKLSLMHLDNQYIFVHAGLNPDLSLENQDPSDILWIRKSFLQNKKDWGRKVIHGHTVCKYGPQIESNRINIDTGAYLTGNLTALMIDRTTDSVKTNFITATDKRSKHIIYDPDNLGSYEWYQWNIQCAKNSFVKQILVCNDKIGKSVENLISLQSSYRLIKQNWLIERYADKRSRLSQSISNNLTYLSFVNLQDEKNFAQAVQIEKQCNYDI